MHVGSHPSACGDTEGTCLRQVCVDRQRPGWRPGSAVSGGSLGPHHGPRATPRATFLSPTPTEAALKWFPFPAAEEHEDWNNDLFLCV